jgi:hypothetical protein
VISTRNLKELLEIDKLKKLCQSIAMLEVLNSPNVDTTTSPRTYSFDVLYNKEKHLFNMYNGSGDTFQIQFDKFGAIIVGFDHEAEMSPYQDFEVYPGVIDQVPSEWQDFINNDYFFSRSDNLNMITFCIWRKYSDPSWNIGNIDFPEDEFNNDPDGSERLLFILDGNPETYQKIYNTAYPEKDYQEYPDLWKKLEPIKYFYDYKPLTEKIIKEIDPDLTIESLKKDIEEIGYPTE